MTLRRLMMTLCLVGFAAACGSDDDDGDGDGGGGESCVCKCACCDTTGMCDTPAELDASSSDECDEKCTTQCGTNFSKSYVCVSQ